MAKNLVFQQIFDTNGTNGKDGNDGVSPTISTSKSNGVTTITMKDANGTKTATINDGTNGKDGKTPVKGTDYWTPADQESIVQQVIAALGTPVFGRVDENNNIILTGELADGSYIIKYEDGEGNTQEIGTITAGASQQPQTFRVPITWLFNVKLSKTTGVVESTSDGDYNASEFIELVDGASYVLATQTDVYNACSVVYYNDSNAFVGYQANLWESNTTVDDPMKGTAQSVALQIPSGATKIRLREWENWNVQGDSTKYITLTGTIG